MKSLKILNILLLAALLLAACTSSTVTVTQPAAVTLPPVETSVPTAAPTLTPTALPQRVLLIADPVDGSLQSSVEALAVDSGLEFEMRPGLQAADLTPDVKIVIFQNDTPAVLELANTAPGTQFVVMSSQDLAPGTNLSVIRRRPEYLIFSAGYLAAISAPDWRAGALLPDNGVLGASAQDAFINGARYWCGRCAPTYGPIVLFPLVGVQPAGSPTSTWQAAFDGINQSRIEVLYVAPEAASPELFDALIAQGVVLSGSAAPSAAARERWAATIAEDVSAPLREMWPDLVAGIGGHQAASSVALQDVNPNYLTPGRQLRVEEVIDLLAQGLINPLSVP